MENLPKPKLRGAIGKWTKNVWVVSILTGLATGLLVWWFTYDRPRQLTVYVDPTAAAVVQRGETSNLIVTHRGTEVTTDVTAIQVSLWNAGDVAIRGQHVLSPIKLRLSGGTPILEATVRKSSREVVGLNLDTSEAKDGVVKVSWSILEKEDGGVIQVVYAGGEAAILQCEGVIEGQKKVEVSNGAAVKKATASQRKWTERALTSLMFLFSILVGAFFIRRGQLPRSDKLLFGTAAAASATVFIASALRLGAANVKPPW